MDYLYNILDGLARRRQIAKDNGNAEQLKEIDNQINDILEYLYKGYSLTFFSLASIAWRCS